MFIIFHSAIEIYLESNNKMETVIFISIITNITQIPIYIQTQFRDRIITNIILLLPRRNINTINTCTHLCIHTHI